MRLAIFSDIHANIHAMHAVWDDIESQAPEAAYCLGDLVGYGAYPNEVVDFIRQREVPTIKGNYDQGVGFELNDCGCVYKDPEDIRRGDRSLMWSRAETTDVNKNFLKALPDVLRLEFDGRSILLVHGSPRRINEYLYEDRPIETFERIVEQSEADMIFFGHTHLPYIKQVNKTTFVNSGSVGQPKDADPRAGYILLDFSREPQIEIRRVIYDAAAAARAVRLADLPDHYADLLETGGVDPEVDQGVSALAEEEDNEGELP